MIGLPYSSNEEFPVSGFLQCYDCEKTAYNYRIAIQNYLHIVKNSDLAYGRESLDRVAFEYLNEVMAGRSVVNDLRYAAGLYQKCYAPSTARLQLSSICLWLEDCGITLRHRDRQRIFMHLPPAYPVRTEAEITRSLFQKLYRNLRHDWLKVLLLVLLASGMRIGEALALQKKDIVWDQSRVAVHIPACITKTRVGRIVYLTREASEALKTYLDRQESERMDGRVFPYSCAMAEFYMRDAVDAAGYGKKGATPRLVHWHMTRKWFISRFSLYASKEIAEELAGHAGYLSRSYQRFTRRQILWQYQKAEKYLELFPQMQGGVGTSRDAYRNGDIETFIALQGQ